VARAISELADKTTRGRAVAFLAVGGYSPTLLAELLSETSGEALAHGRAIEAWREGGPWFLDERDSLLEAANNVLMRNWPIAELRAFAIAHLDRLARIDEVEHEVTDRPQVALLASIRYSPDPDERRLLEEYARTAPDSMAKIARRILEEGLTWYGGDNPEFSHWKALPPR
jgi:hypothetical protein